MKTLKYTLIPLCAALLASCGELNVDSPEATQPETPQTEGTVLTATIGQATKTILGDKDAQGKYKVSWAIGDKINVNGDESAEAVIAEDGTASFSFGKEMTAPFKAVYPSAAFKSVEGEVVTVTVSSTQTYAAGTFDAASALMYASAEEGTALTFHHLMAYLKLSFTTASDLDKIKTVSLKARGTESMSGDFTLDFSAETPALASASEKAGSIIVNCGEEGIALGKEVIVAVPAQTYASGLEIVTTDVNGDKTTHLLKPQFEAKAGTVYPMPIEFELYPGSRLKPITVKEKVDGVDKDVVWAPVYCGYSAEHPNGLLYQYGRAKGQPYYPAPETDKTILKDGPVDTPDDNFFYKKNGGDWYSGTSLKEWPRKEGDAGYIKDKIDNPCPDGWRLPTIAEAQGLVDIGFVQPDKWVNSTPSGTDAQKEATYISNGFTLKDSDLFFPAAGGRTSGGKSFYRSYVSTNDEYARMWTSDAKTNDDAKATMLSIRRNKADAGKTFACEVTSIVKATGISVRCVKE